MTVCGVLTLTFGGSDRKTYGWAALFLVPAAVALGFGYWQITIARTAQEAGGGPPCAP